jgi:small subunit ribosomal protein S6
MRDYELAFIVNPNIESEGVTNVVDKVSQLIETGNGKVASVDVWGRRSLTYAIKDYKEGTYVLLKATIPPASLSEFERELKLTEQIIRYMLIKVDS